MIDPMAFLLSTSCIIGMIRLIPLKKELLPATGSWFVNTYIKLVVTRWWVLRVFYRSDKEIFLVVFLIPPNLNAAGMGVRFIVSWWNTLGGDMKNICSMHHHYVLFHGKLTASVDPYLWTKILQWSGIVSFRISFWTVLSYLSDANPQQCFPTYSSRTLERSSLTEK